MRVSGVVRRASFCCKKVRLNKAPETMNVAIERPSFQFQVEPANVKTMVNDTIAPVAQTNPTQSRFFSFRRIGASEAPFGVTEGR